jgi:hypothetical protein
MARPIVFIALLVISPVLVLAGVWQDIFSDWVSRGNVTRSQLRGQHVSRRAHPGPASLAWLDEGATFIKRRNDGLLNACQGRNSTALKHAWDDIHTMSENVRNAIQSHINGSAHFVDTPIVFIGDLKVLCGVPAANNAPQPVPMSLFDIETAAFNSSLATVAEHGDTEHEAIHHVYVNVRSLVAKSPSKQVQRVFDTLEGTWIPAIFQHDSEVSPLFYMSRENVPLYGAYIEGIGMLLSPSLMSCHAFDGSNSQICTTYGMESAYHSPEEAYTALRDAYVSGAARTFPGKVLRRSLQLENAFIPSHAASRNLHGVISLSHGVPNVLFVRVKFYGQDDNVIMSHANAQALMDGYSQTHFVLHLGYSIGRSLRLCNSVVFVVCFTDIFFHCNPVCVRIHHILHCIVGYCCSQLCMGRCSRCKHDTIFG